MHASHALSVSTLSTRDVAHKASMCTPMTKSRGPLSPERFLCALKQMTSVYVGHSYVKSKVLTKGECQDRCGRTKGGFLDRPGLGSVLH